MEVERCNAVLGFRHLRWDACPPRRQHGGCPTSPPPIAAVQSRLAAACPARRPRAPTFALGRALNTPRQIQQLDLCIVVVDDACGPV